MISGQCQPTFPKLKVIQQMEEKHKTERNETRTRGQTGDSPKVSGKVHKAGDNLLAWLPQPVTLLNTRASVIQVEIQLHC